MKKKQKQETRVAQGLHYQDSSSGSIIPPINTSTTFARNSDYELISEKHSYGRDENPTFLLPEKMLSELEGGEEALLFSSGMAAAVSVFQALDQGDHILAPKIMYWGLREWLIDFTKKWGIDITFYDPNQPDALRENVIKGKTKLIWLETPCNPTWDIIDIEEASIVAKSINAKLAVDSTVSTPVLTRPIDFGADIVMHSATKYLNGHGDLVAGALICSKKDPFWEKIRNIRLHGGAIIGSFEAWLLQRGMRTLFLRVKKASDNALKIANYFENHKKISCVLYPGLESHPKHEIAKKQMKGGYGGMLSFIIKGGEIAALEFVKHCSVFMRATSLGGVESLIEHRYSIEGESSPIPKDLVRISVGIEAPDDLIEDLENSINNLGKSSF